MTEELPTNHRDNPANDPDADADIWSRIAKLLATLPDPTGWTVRILLVTDGRPASIRRWPIDEASPERVQSDIGGGKYQAQALRPSGTIYTQGMFAVADPPARSVVAAPPPPAAMPAPVAAPALDTNLLLVTMLKGQQETMAALAARPPTQGLSLSDVLPLLKPDRGGLSQLKEAIEFMTMIRGDGGDDEDGDGGGTWATIGRTLGRTLAERLAPEKEAPAEPKPMPAETLPARSKADARTTEAMLRHAITVSLHWTARLCASMLDAGLPQWRGLLRAHGADAARPIIAENLVGAPAWYIDGVVKQLTALAGEALHSRSMEAGAPAPAGKAIEHDEGKQSEQGDQGGGDRSDARGQGGEHAGGRDVRDIGRGDGDQRPVGAGDPSSDRARQAESVPSRVGRGGGASRGRRRGSVPGGVVERGELGSEGDDRADGGGAEPH